MADPTFGSKSGPQKGTPERRNENVNSGPQVCWHLRRSEAHRDLLRPGLGRKRNGTRTKQDSRGLESYNTRQDRMS